MAEARAKAAAQAQAQAPIAAAPPATSEQTSRFITAPELSDRDGIDARNLTRGDADADGYAAATYDAASAPSDASSEAAAAAPTATRGCSRSWTSPLRPVGRRVRAAARPPSPPLPPSPPPFCVVVGFPVALATGACRGSLPGVVVRLCSS